MKINWGAFNRSRFLFICVYMLIMISITTMLQIAPSSIRRIKVGIRLSILNIILLLRFLNKNQLIKHPINVNRYTALGRYILSIALAFVKSVEKAYIAMQIKTSKLLRYTTSSIVLLALFIFIYSMSLQVRMLYMRAGIQSSMTYFPIQFENTY